MRTGPTTFAGTRTEVIGFLPIVSRVDVRLGAALMSWDDHAGAEGQLGMRLGF